MFTGPTAFTTSPPLQHTLESLVTMCGVPVLLTILTTMLGVFTTSIAGHPAQAGHHRHGGTLAVAVLGAVPV